MLNVDMYMPFEEWVVGVKPNKNHLDQNARFDGMLYEHAPAELEYLSQMPPHQLWTLYEEDGIRKIRNGLHQDLPGRLGYLHSKVYFDIHRVFLVPDAPSSI